MELYDALWFSAAHDKFVEAACLLKYGADANYMYQSELNVLTIVVNHSNFAVATLLLLAGATIQKGTMDTLMQRQGSLFLAFERFYSNAPDAVKAKMMELARNPTHSLGCVFNRPTKWRLGRESISDKLKALEANGVDPKQAKKFPAKKTYCSEIAHILGLANANEDVAQHGSSEEVKKEQPESGFYVPDGGVKVMF